MIKHFFTKLKSIRTSSSTTTVKKDKYQERLENTRLLIKSEIETFEYGDEKLLQLIVYRKYHEMYGHLLYIKDNFEVELPFIKYQNRDIEEVLWDDDFDGLSPMSLRHEIDMLRSAIFCHEQCLYPLTEFALDQYIKEDKFYVENEFKEIMLNFSQRMEIELLCHNAKKETQDCINSLKTDLKNMNSRYENIMRNERIMELKRKKEREEERRRKKRKKFVF